MNLSIFINSLSIMTEVYTELSLLNNEVSEFYKDNSFLVKKRDNALLIDEKYEYVYNKEDNNDHIKKITDKNDIDSIKKSIHKTFSKSVYKISEGLYSLGYIDSRYKKAKSIADFIELTSVYEGDVEQDDCTIIFKNKDVVLELTTILNNYRWIKIMFKNSVSIHFKNKDCIDVHIGINNFKTVLTYRSTYISELKKTYESVFAVSFYEDYNLIFDKELGYTNKKFLLNNPEILETMEKINGEKIDLNFDCDIRMIDKTDYVDVDVKYDYNEDSDRIQIRSIKENSIEIDCKRIIKKDDPAIIMSYSNNDLNIFIDSKNSAVRGFYKGEMFIDYNTEEKIFNKDIYLKYRDDIQKLLIDISTIEYYNLRWYDFYYCVQSIFNTQKTVYAYIEFINADKNNDMNICADLCFLVTIYGKGRSVTTETVELGFKNSSSQSDNIIKNSFSQSDNTIKNRIGNTFNRINVPHPIYENITVSMFTENTAFGYKKVINFLGSANKTINTLIKDVSKVKITLTIVKHDGSFIEKVFDSSEESKKSIRLKDSESFITGWKGCITKDKEPAVVKLRIPNTSKLDTQHGTKFRTDKCTPIGIYRLEQFSCYKCKNTALGTDIKDRLVCEDCVESGEVKNIFNFERMTPIDSAFSCIHDSNFEYKLNQPIEIKNFAVRSEDCGVGIHFFKESERLIKYCFSSCKTASSDDHTKYLSIY